MNNFISGVKEPWYFVEVINGSEHIQFLYFDLMFYDLPGKVNYHFTSDGSLLRYYAPAVFVLPGFWKRVYKGHCEKLRICLTADSKQPSLWVREFENVDLSIYKKAQCCSLFINNISRLWVEDPEYGVVDIA